MFHADFEHCEKIIFVGWEVVTFCDELFESSLADLIYQVVCRLMRL